METPPCFRAGIPVGNMRNIIVRFAGWPAEIWARFCPVIAARFPAHLRRPCCDACVAERCPRRPPGNQVSCLGCKRQRGSHDHSRRARLMTSGLGVCVVAVGASAFVGHRACGRGVIAVPFHGVIAVPSLAYWP